jgi:CheY-like chemotaxis protein
MKNILYVDDSGAERELMELAIERSAKTLRLKTVASGELACEYLEGAGPFVDRTRFPPPDFVILDLKMGAMSGFDVLRWMRERPETAGLKVAIYSSSFGDSDVDTGYRLGADAFITKPSSWPRQAEFVRLVEQCLCSEPPDLSLLRALPEYRTPVSGGDNPSPGREPHGRVIVK